jgi:3-dehydroquinate dehydratase-1
MKPLVIKDVSIGEGAPKTIVSVMDATTEGALATIDQGLAAGVDCFEWRVDFSENVHDPAAAAEESRVLAQALPKNPLLFTFRSTSQGGQLTIPVEEYVTLNKAVIEAEAIDMVDIETWIGDAAVSDLVACAHAHGVAAVVSYHNFAGTPSKDWMVALLTHMQDLGADIPKIAVMAKTPADALELLAATEEMARLHAQGPLLTMAMGRDGSITRLAGELFGSALTFCALENASAPGQVDVSQARRIMADLHEVLGK